MVSEGDYHLGERSPLIDQGSAEGAPTSDLAGNARPCGSGIDIGAYESCGIQKVTLFIRGDSNEDARQNLSDAISMFDFLFMGDSPPSCLSSADANDDGAVDCSDPIFLLNYLFLGTSSPGEPFSGCGNDPTADMLACSTQPVCLEFDFRAGAK